MKTFSRVLVFVLYGSVPLSALLLFLGKAVFFRSEPRSKKRSKPTRQQKRRRGAAAKKRLSSPRLGKAAVAVLPIALTAVGLHFSHDPMTRAFVLAHDYSVERQWGEILELNRRLPKGASHPYLNHDVIRALYHMGDEHVQW